MVKFRIPLISSEQAEEVDYTVCMPLGPSAFDDNKTGVCCKCGRQVMFRPYVPKKPPKICLDCAAGLEGESDAHDL
jgi:hypothetical protein